MPKAVKIDWRIEAIEEATLRRIENEVLELKSIFKSSVRNNNLEIWFKDFLNDFYVKDIKTVVEEYNWLKSKKRELQNQKSLDFITFRNQTNQKFPRSSEYFSLFKLKIVDPEQERKLKSLKIIQKKQQTDQESLLSECICW